MAAIRPVEKELSDRCQGMATSRWHDSMINAEWSRVGPGGGIYQLFQEMEERDAHLFATLQTRKNALLACPWKVIAVNDSPPAQQAATLVNENLNRLPSLSSVLFNLMDALAKGFSIAEIIWQIDGDNGGVYAMDIRTRNQSDFAFNSERDLYMLAEQADRFAPLVSSGQKHLIPRPGESMISGQRAQLMPGRKFIHFASQGNSCSPYGSALCLKAYWYYWLKKNTLQNWSLFNEKFGSPTAVARYSEDTSEEELRRLEATIASLPRDSGVLLPNGVGLEFLEARRSSGINTYRELADWCNDEISKIVLGQTLTTSEGRRSGSLALGQVHETVRRDYLASDAATLGQILTTQLSRWITDFNFGIHTPAPRIVFDVDPPEKFESELAVDRELIKMGVPISADYFYQRYRRPVPQAGERTLRYDDANLYQYHLLHGVLTINEVRKTLGLEPVPWGDKPTGRNTQQRERQATDGQQNRGGSRDVDVDEGETEADEALADHREK